MTTPSVFEDRARWFWRRLATFLTSTVCAGVAIVAVIRAPDPQWIGIAAIVALWLAVALYTLAATWDGIVRFTQAIAEGIKRATDQAP